MKWLNLDLIKQQLRMEHDFILEDDLLTLYGDSAEDAVLTICNRTMEDVVEQYGRVPSQLVHASLLLVSESYQHREPISAQNLYMVPYAFDRMVKPYMRLADKKEC